MSPSAVTVPTSVTCSRDVSLNEPDTGVMFCTLMPRAVEPLDDLHTTVTVCPAFRLAMRTSTFPFRFRQPFTNYNFYDLDNFTVSFQLDGEAFLLQGCMWDDFRWVTDKAEFREHISIAALKMRRETHNEGS